MSCQRSIVSCQVRVVCIASVTLCGVWGVVCSVGCCTVRVAAVGWQVPKGHDGRRTIGTLLPPQ